MSKFELSEQQLEEIIYQLDDTGGYLIKGSEIKYWINLYVNSHGYREVMECLLKEKKILPTLIGIHPVLDAEIAKVLK